MPSAFSANPWPSIASAETTSAPVTLYLLRYNVTLVDPVGYKFAYVLSDICRAIASGIRSLGYRCDLTTNNIDAGAINIMVGTHLLSAQDLGLVQQSGSQYIALHTEWLSPGDPPYNVKSTFQGNNFEPTQRAFLEGALAVWEAWESNIQMLSRFDIPAERFKRFWVGYHEDLEEIRHRPYADKDIDALFVGSITPRRQTILQGLAQSMFVQGVFDSPHPFRNDFIARSKINLALFSDPALNYFSFLRIGYALNNHAFVVSEPSINDRGMQDLIVTVEAERMAERCTELIQSGDIPRLAEEGYERYRQLPMTDVVKELLG
jgi:hypothetical protein